MKGPEWNPGLRMKNLRIPLRVVFYRDGDVWVAHCLEFDLMGDGATKEDALDELIEAINLQVAASVEADNPSNLFSPADGRFFAMFAAGKDVVVGALRLHFDSVTIDEAETREFDPSELALA
jgi:predicted RNase H-like HicB family nuclease